MPSLMFCGGASNNEIFFIFLNLDESYLGIQIQESSHMFDKVSELE